MNDTEFKSCIEGSISKIETLLSEIKNSNDPAIKAGIESTQEDIKYLREILYKMPDKPDFNKMAKSHCPDDTTFGDSIRLAYKCGASDVWMMFQPSQTVSTLPPTDVR